LVKSAAAGEDPIINDKLRPRAEWLLSERQQIHAGRMLSEHPKGVPDFRPEQAKEAKLVAELVVRGVVEWLQRHPAADA
jgi:hypothetical protein